MSRLAEILGVEEDQEFMFEGTKYRIHDGNRQYFCCEWRDAASEDILTRIINHPEKINRLHRWTEQDREDAKALKRMIVDIVAVYRHRDGDTVNALYKDFDELTTPEWTVEICHDLFPSLKPGESAKLDEIIGGAE